MTETSAPGQTAVVRAESLTRRFGSVLADDDLSFALAPGTITGFLGPNGAGKTTTLRMLLGLTAPSAGRALVLLAGIGFGLVGEALGFGIGSLALHARHIPFALTTGQAALMLGGGLAAVSLWAVSGVAVAPSSAARSARSSACSPGA